MTLAGAFALLSKVLLAVFLIVLAMLALPLLGGRERHSSRRTRFLPLLIAALLMGLLFLKFIVGVVLATIAAVFLISVLLRVTRRHLFGKRNVPLWVVATIIVALFYGLLFLYRCVIR